MATSSIPSTRRMDDRWMLGCGARWYAASFHTVAELRVAPLPGAAQLPAVGADVSLDTTLSQARHCGGFLAVPRKSASGAADEANPRALGTSAEGA